GRADRTMALLHAAGVKAVETDGESWRCDGHGDLRRVDDENFRTVTSIFDGASSLQNDESVDQFLRRFEGDHSMLEFVSSGRTFVEGFDAADPAIASVRGIAEELRSGIDYAAARPIGGYQPLFAHLHKEVTEAGVRLLLSTIVR